MNEELKKKIIEAQNGNKNTLNELVKDNLGLVYNISKRYVNRGYEIEDIVQIGSIGLIKAIKKFDFNYNVMLSTFAVTYIIGEIKRFFRDDGDIKISREIKELSVKIKEEQKKNENITINELVKKLNASKDEILLAISSDKKVESLEDKIDDDGLSLLDKLPNSNEENNEEKLVRKLALKESIEKLNNEDKELIYLRYFKNQTQSNTAKIIGISQVQVSRKEKKILKILERDLA